jgi:hypothetical protein
MLLKHLQVKLVKEQEKLDNLQKWLNDHFDHPNFCMIARDRNAQSVTVNTIQFKIDQLTKKQPILGEEIHSSEAVVVPKAENGFKSIQ